MLERKFEENGIVYELHRESERDHTIIVYLADKSEVRLTEKYTCVYPALFGKDTYDWQQLEEILDRMIGEIHGME